MTLGTFIICSEVAAVELFSLYCCFFVLIFFFILQDLRESYSGVFGNLLREALNN